MPVLAVIEAYVPPPRCVTLTRYFYPPSERSDEVLIDQLRQGEDLLTRIVVRPLHLFQLDALICLASDVVSGLAASPMPTLEKSVLVHALNKGMFQIAAAEFHVFCYAEGVVQTRLWEKRKAESYLFSRGHLLFE